MVYVFSPEGACLERNGWQLDSPYPRPDFEANHGPDIVLVAVDEDPAPDVPLAFITLVEGQITVDPAYTPPTPATMPDLAAEVAALKATVAANLLASPHDRRWLAQKERAKLFGIPWLKANPTATQAELEAAVIADLEAAFPGEPIVAGAGVIMSYATEAFNRGYIAAATFEALAALVVGASDSQIQAMLAVL